jgi:hypothetical protein
MTDQFKYDIAFSFLSKDEPVAQEINDLLQDRYRTFIYSEHQKKLAGTDGEETFKRVFAKEARLVAVLFRPEWGTTPWTRIEQTAVRDRAHDEGYDFCTFISMKEHVERPAWLPKNRLLYLLNRFGLKGAAAALEGRLQEQGVTVHEETVADRGQRLKRAAEFAAEADQFRRSEEGVRSAKVAFQAIVESLTKLSEQLSNSTGMRFLPSYHQTWRVHLVRSPKAVLVIGWRGNYVNRLDGSHLAVSFYDRVPRWLNAFADDERELESTKYDFRLVSPSRPAWVHEQTEIAPDDMADYLMKRLMHHNEMELDRKK